MLHPALEPYVRSVAESAVPDPTSLSPADRRAAYRALAESMRGELVAVASSTDVTLALDGRVLPARLYRPVADDETALIVYFHGGSFVAGDLDTHDELCRRLATDTRMRLLAVDYRLAPENAFPASIDDAVDVMRHVSAHFMDYATEGSKLIVLGDSAGATLIAVATALTRGEGLGIAAQVLIYPTLGPEMLTDSSHTYAKGYLLDVEHLRHDYRQYLGAWRDHTDPRVSPLMFADLTGAPPAIVLVAECDPLRDEGVAYAGLLEHFGVPVELLEAEGMIHGFLRMGGLVPEAIEIVDDLAAHMRRYAERAPS